MSTRLRSTGTAAALAVAALGAGCDNAGTDLGFPEVGTGSVRVEVFLDRDGSRTFSALDTTFAGGRIALLQPVSRDTLRVATSGPNGRIVFANVTVGQYTVVAVPGSLGDSLVVGEIEDPDLILEPGTDTVVVRARLTYPAATIQEARVAPAGKRVFLRGYILSGVQSFRDTTSHMADATSAMRLTDVVLKGGQVANFPGDTVVVLGTVGARGGQPVLAKAEIYRYGTRPAPLPTIVNTTTAAAANGGALDAGLVQVIAAAIVDTATIQPDFSVVVNDGSGPLTLLLDANIPFARSAFVIGRQLTGRGVLVPAGAGIWRLKPRDPGDVSLF